ncbi:MAG: MFS transporter [Hyphomonadaceae bacterium]|uniref:MFS transporter n=1 Tax=Aquidulcibacter sp. TaxID=2052990 RepID=UPI0022BE0154|nr:MFS transporter [Aquidulcibacter sp.]MCE2889569.1 MFS transporter [Hyphomonadaceae bacterium]MCZ8208323.1 MFS transporter [Aquidulcibacter sp.]
MSQSLAPFKHVSFARYWCARVFWTLGTQIQITAMGWQVYDIARARGDTIEEGAFLLGLIGLSQFVPLLILSLFGGQAADRFDRRLIILVCIALKVAIAGALVAASGFAPSALIAAIFAVAMVTGMLNAFLPAASSAMVSNLVPRDQLPQAIALMSLSFQGGSVLGPALGGLLFHFGANVPYSAALGLFICGWILAFWTKAPPQEKVESGRTFAMIKEGLIYVRDNKIVLGALSLDLAVVLLAGATALLPVFARDILHAGPTALGALRSAGAIGAGVVSIFLAIKPIERNVGRWMFGAVFVFGLATLGFGLSTTLWVSVACLAIAGAADMISVYVRSSLVQLATPDAMRGRVSAISFVFISASNEMGEFQSGVAARLLGPVTAVVAGGIGAVMIAGAWMRLFKPLAEANRFEDAAPENQASTKAS